ncbi:MAG: gamma-glutamylcyclotransferase family protein [Candidatus Thermoplasmatota archaeon]
MHRLFVYGTLTDARQVTAVLGRTPPSRPAVLPGFRAEPHPAGPWPVAAPDPATRLAGILLEELAEEDLRLLDVYEGVAEGLYARTAVTAEVDGRRVGAWAYVKL